MGNIWDSNEPTSDFNDEKTGEDTSAVDFETNAKVFHLDLTPSQGAKYAIIVGDPERVEKVAAHLEKPEFVTANREYTTWTGLISGVRVLVTSHGIGGPSTAICVEELARCGVDTFIRVGTCGGMALEVCGGDLVIANSAIRQDGTSNEYLPKNYPATSDFAVTTALARACEALSAYAHVGVVQSKDSFYGQHAPHDSPMSEQLISQWNAYLKAGCLASEMEAATLYAVAAAKGLRAGCILHVIWNQERAKVGLEDEHCFDNSASIKAAIEALRLLIEAD